jgi:hypothetical protein
MAARLLLTLLGALGALLGAAGAAKEKATDAPPAPALYRIVNGETSHYLFGSFPVLPTGADWRSRAVARAIEASEALWFEAPVSDPVAQKTAARIFATEGKMPKGKSLLATLPDGADAWLAPVAAEAGVDAAAIGELKPWAAFVVLSGRMFKSADLSLGESVETAVQREALGRGRPVRFLDTTEGALGVLTKMPDADQAGLLAHLLADWSRQRDAVGDAFEAWRLGDDAATDAYANAAMREEAPAAYDRLITKRVATLADRLGPVLAGKESAFITVNAGFLVGEGALPAALAERGFVVERVAGE